MKSFKEKLLVMLGREPQKPAAYSPEAEQIHKLKRLNKADFEAMKQLLHRPAVFDGRNLYDPERMAEMGFDYFSIGRPYQGRSISREVVS